MESDSEIYKCYSEVNALTVVLPMKTEDCCSTLSSMCKGREDPKNPNHFLNLSLKKQCLIGKGHESFFIS
jgi:hypothetical protein